MTRTDRRELIAALALLRADAARERELAADVAAALDQAPWAHDPEDAGLVYSLQALRNEAIEARDAGLNSDVVAAVSFAMRSLATETAVEATGGRA